MVTDPLPRDRPLWSAVLVTGLVENAVALVVVLHHVLADGIGGLAILASLLDQVAGPPPTPFPRPPAYAAQLAADALGTRLAALSRMGAAWRILRRSIAAGGGLHPARAAPCSLVQPTGPRRRIAVVRGDLTELRAAAHRHGSTVNDVVLAAVTGALHRLLEERGETVDRLAVAVPVAGRRSTTAGQLGNQIAPMLVVLPATGDPTQRLRQIAATTRAHKTSATGPPAPRCWERCSGPRPPWAACAGT